MSTAHIILALLWIIYVVLHSALAAGKFKNWMKAILGSNYGIYRLIYNIFALIGLVLIIWYEVEMISPLVFKPILITDLVGIVVGVFGLIFMVILIGKYFMQESGLRSLVAEQKSGQLMVGGLHRYVRHPIYLATFLFLWGMFLFIPYLSVLISNLVITIYTLIAIRFEEAKLIKEFGDQYKLYRKQVPMILPSFR